MNQGIINLRLTMESGQPPQFIWNKEPANTNGTMFKERYSRLVNGEKLDLWVDEGRLRFTEGFDEYVHEFLRLDDDLSEIYKAIGTDAKMRCAIECSHGLRITKNDPWETLVCFLCSINNNIPRIRKMVQSLMVEGEVMRPEEMAARNLGGLRLGFREKYLKGCAELTQSYELEKISLLDYEEAWVELQEFPGVGPKVADCVLLFGFGFLEAFPVDVWIEKTMKKLYATENGKDARRKAAEKWGRFAGYAQQYLYYAERCNAGKCERAGTASRFAQNARLTR